MKRISKYIILAALAFIGVCAKAVTITDAEVDFSKYTEISEWGFPYSWGGSESARSRLSIQNGCLHFHNTEAIDPYWDCQFFPIGGVNAEIGVTYTLHYKIKGTVAQNVSMLGFGQTPWGEFPITTEWVEGTVDYEAKNNDGNILMQCGDYVGDWDIAYLKITHEDEWVEQLTNGDAETPWTAAQKAIAYNDQEKNYTICAWSKEKGRNLDSSGDWNPFPADIEKVDGSHVFVVHGKPATTEGDASAWDNQFWIQSSNMLKVGSRFKLSFRYKASEAVTVNSQYHHQTPGDYVHWYAIGDVNFTTEWQTYEDVHTVPNEATDAWSIAFNLNPEKKNAINFYFDDISLSIEEEDRSYGLSISTQGNGFVTYGSTNVTNYQHFDVKSGNSVTLTFTPNRGYQLSQLLVNGKDVIEEVKDNKYTIRNVSNDIVVIATFTESSVDGLFERLVNGDCEGSGVSCFVVKNGGEDLTEAHIEKGIGYNGSRGIRIHSIENVAEDWDTQFFISTPDHIWKEGERYRVEFKVRADKPAHISAQSHYAPGEYIYWDFANGGYDVTTEWQMFSYDGTISKEQAAERGMYTMAFNLNELRDDNYYYFDDMSWSSVIGTYSYGLTINTQGKGTVTYGSANVTNYQRFDEKIGTSVTLAFTPDEGYLLSQVLVNGEDVTKNLKDNTYTFTIIDSDVIVFATFTEKTGTFSEKGISYSILSAPEKTVLVNKNTSYRGNLTIPETVTHSGEEWKVDGIVANAFNNCTNLVTISLPKSLKSRNMGVSLFTGCTKLAAITWNADFNLTSSVLGAVNNPNLLFYTKSASYAPNDINNIIVNGTAERIVLQDVATGSDNFYCPTAFTAKEISYNHNYTMESAYGGVGGWETLALPFTVQQITHERAGDIVPFAAYDGVHCPFWLYTYSSSGFVRTGTIEANIPYIICMPNNSEYNTEYLLSGKVTFSAQDALVASSDGTAQNEQPTRGQKTFIAAYKAKTREKTSSVYAMNVVNDIYSETGSYTPGSIFISDLRNVSPFEAVMTSNGAACRVITLDFDETTGIKTLPVANSSIYRVYNLHGQLLIQSDNAVEKDRLIDQLPAGVYIVNGKKMIINK